MYLSLRQLLDRGGDAAELLAEALAPSPAGATPASEEGQDPLGYALARLALARTVTLDLYSVSEQESEQHAEGILRVLQRNWGRHAFCLSRCRSISPWGRAAHNVPRSLLLWHGFTLQQGWVALGPPINGMDRLIFRSLCFVEHAGAAELALDASVVSQHTRITSHTLPQIAMDMQLGRAPHGPDGRGGPHPADEQEIQHRLFHLERAGYIIEVVPRGRRYRAVLPSPPGMAARA